MNLLVYENIHAKEMDTKLGYRNYHHIPTLISSLDS